MKIQSDIKHIRKASAEIEDFLRANKIDESAIFDIRLSVEEAIKNAILHGNKGRKGLPVSISYELRGGKFTVEVEDAGSGFTPAELPGPTKDENLTKAGGRGVFLMQKLMDEAKYNARGNKVSMLKYVKSGKGGR